MSLERRPSVSCADFDHLIKIVHIGDSGVGKSGLLVRFCDNAFMHKYVATIGVDFKIRTVTVGGKVIKLQLWDTAGQERFKALTSTYYRLAEGFIVCYDISRPETFFNVREWVVQVQEAMDIDNSSMILVGCKCDVATDSRAAQVTSLEGQRLALSLGVAFLETSAKSNQNVEEVYITLLSSILEKKQRKERRLKKKMSTASARRLSDSDSDTSGCC